MERVEFTGSGEFLVTQVRRGCPQDRLLRSPPNLKGIYALGLLNEVLQEKNLPPVAE
jgi:hypothetical protein